MTMNAYIEVVIIDNMIVTGSIAILSYVLLGMRVRKLRTLLAAIFGTAISITYPFWQMSTPLLIASKIIIGIMLGIILFAGLHKVVQGVFSFFVLTGLMGGICIMTQYILTGDIGEALTGTPVLPYCVPTLIAVITTLLVRAIIVAAKRQRLKSAYNYKVRLTIAGKAVELQGYLDTGNSLYDDKSDLPIVIIKKSSLEKAYGHEALLENICGFKVIETVTSKTGKIFLIKPDDFLLYYGKHGNKHNDVMLGISEVDFSRQEDMLLHPSVIGG